MTRLKRLALALFSILLLCCSQKSIAQNSMTGDGFGGRSWYTPYNYEIGSYSANIVCPPDSQLYVWGGNNTQQLANITVSSSDTAFPVAGMNHVKFRSTGYFSAVIKADNSAWVWGYYLLNNITHVLDNVKFVDAGAEHVVLVKYDGTVWGVGTNGSGQLGNGAVGHFPVVTTPVQMTGVTNAVRAVAVGYGAGYDDPNVPFHAASIILLADKTVKITGGYPWFTPDSSNVPIAVPELFNIIDIKGNSFAAYALNAAGEVYSFGSETVDYNYGTLGIGQYTGGYHAPAKLTFPAGAAPIVAISACDDGDHAFALDENGNVYGWGNSDYGQMGNGSAGNFKTPVLCATNAIDIYAGETFSYILKADNSLWAAGHGIFGSLFMDHFNDFYYSFVQLDPTGPFMHLCPVRTFGVLPTKLLNFNAGIRGNTTHLSWQSATEENLNSYTIEYSADTRNFKTIASVIAKGSAGNYDFDHTPGSKLAFYRLKMMDNDGNYTYSQIRSVKFGDPAYFTIAPNPVGNEIGIYDIKTTDIKSIWLFSSKGELLKKLDEPASDKRLDVSGFTAGVYFLKLLTKTGDVKLQKFVKY